MSGLQGHSQSIDVMDNVCIPMHLDAFALSPDCCDGASSIAPFTQPNYAALRLDTHYIQQDVLDHTDFHSTSPANKNPRLADIGADPANNLKPSRMGVHLHWSLPRCYRSATASGATDQPKNLPANADTANPVFPLIPNRWLVTRHLKNFADDNVIPQYQSWVVESDLIRKITEINDGGVDLESDVAPFVAYSGDPTAQDALKAQTEIFLGQKFNLPWKEDSTRVHTPLTIMNSSNPLFADFALHDINVLSIIDNFQYTKGTQNAYLANAKCDYYVIGWHQNSESDPLNIASQADLNTRLSDLLLQLSTDAANTDGLKQGPTKSLCYGAIYDVVYNFAKKPRSLADEAAQKFTAATDMEPLSVGTTALDGILTFLEAHKKNTALFFGQDIGNVADDILAITQLLYASADEYDSRVQAQDLIAQQNFEKAGGGYHWTFSKQAASGREPSAPTVAEAEALSNLNEAQSRLDVATRKLQTLQWELFAEWWKYLSEFIPATSRPAEQKAYTARVDPLKVAAMGKDQKGGLHSLVASLNSQIADLQTKVDCKQAAKPPYYTRTDPTLCVAGLDSGWPADFLDKTSVLLDHELVSDTSAVDALFSGTSNPIPIDHGLQATAKKLLAKCLQNSKTTNGVQGTPQTTGFQAWGNRNPFVPLFMEWESLYYHIDKDSWNVELRPSPVGHPNAQVRYGTKGVLSDSPANLQDVRALSGRVLILPQPTFNLETVVLSVLDNAPPDMQLSQAQIDEIRANIRKIQFISAPLSGITNHLLTRCSGSHVKPNVRVPGKVTVPLATAISASNSINIDESTLKLIDSETALTPYGTLIAFDPMKPKPFKPATHGQMVFTKLNIIDKFGQAICLPSPKPRLRHPIDDSSYNIYPCLSDYLSPDIIKHTDKLNTVRPLTDPQVPGEWPLCKYVQLTPSINQNSRVNAAFLIRDPLPNDALGAWREASDFEQPAFGWIIVNYADYGLQFFLADGTFYCEIRKGGPAGVDTSAKWLPYGAPPKPVGTNVTWQLDQLIALFTQPKDPNGDYLGHFFDMINGSIQNMPFPPSDYAGFANAIVGKPLALVNAGWSLEISTPAIRPQNSLGAVTSNPQADLEAYSFPLKIGDLNRTFDGVVGYYLSTNNTTNPTTDWSKLYTYFVPTPTDSILTITPDHFPTLSPYYIAPESSTTTNMMQAAASKYLVTTLLIDPYTPLHAYSPILPAVSIQLPKWTIESAFNKMQAFFHLGPSLVTVDVPPTADAARAVAATNKPSVRLPVSGHQGLWNWMQPYAATDAAQLPEIVQLGVQGGAVKFEAAPYTFLEGYLQLVGKLGKSDINF